MFAEEASQILQGPLNRFSVFEIIEENVELQEKEGGNFELSSSQGLPFIDLLLINCIMGFVEHTILKKGNLLRTLIFNRNTFVMKNEFKIAYLSAVVEESKEKICPEKI